MKPRVLIADDHNLVLEGLSKLLATDFDVVGTVLDGRALVEAAKTLEPDLILLDIGMPLLNGVEAMRQVHAAMPRVRLVVVSQQSDRHYVRAAFKAGASGYVLKQSASHELITALRTVLAGQYFVTPLVANSTLSTRMDPHVNPADLFGSALTGRQREVLQLIAEGKSAKEMAAILKISPKTVEFHKAAIVDHLGLRSTAELTRYALENGISTR